MPSATWDIGRPSYNHLRSQGRVTFGRTDVEGSTTEWTNTPLNLLVPDWLKGAEAGSDARYINLLHFYPPSRVHGIGVSPDTSSFHGGSGHDFAAEFEDHGIIIYRQGANVIRVGIGSTGQTAGGADLGTVADVVATTVDADDPYDHVFDAADWAIITTWLDALDPAQSVTATFQDDAEPVIDVAPAAIPGTAGSLAAVAVALVAATAGPVVPVAPAAIPGAAGSTAAVAVLRIDPPTPGTIRQSYQASVVASSTINHNLWTLTPDETTHITAGLYDPNEEADAGRYGAILLYRRILEEGFDEVRLNVAAAVGMSDRWEEHGIIRVTRNNPTFLPSRAITVDIPAPQRGSPLVTDALSGDRSQYVWEPGGSVKEDLSNLLDAGDASGFTVEFFDYDPELVVPVTAGAIPGSAGSVAAIPVTLRPAPTVAVAPAAIPGAAGSAVIAVGVEAAPTVPVAPGAVPGAAGSAAAVPIAVQIVTIDVVPGAIPGAAGSVADVPVLAREIVPVVPGGIPGSAGSASAAATVLPAPTIALTPGAVPGAAGSASGAVTVTIIFVVPSPIAGAAGSVAAVAVTTAEVVDIPITPRTIGPGVAGTVTAVVALREKVPPFIPPTGFRLYSDMAMNGGELVAAFEVLQAYVSTAVDGTTRLEVGIAPTSAHADEMLVNRVVRYGNEEWRIARIKRDKNQDGGGLIVLSCEGALHDLHVLAGPAMVAGRVSLAGVYATAGEWLTLALSSPGVPDGWAVGDVEGDDEEYGIAEDGLTPLGLIETVAREAGLEVGLRRTGETGYAVDLLDRIGSDADPVILSDVVNVRTLERQINRRPNRIVPYHEKGSLGDARWRVAAGAGGDELVLADTPAAEVGTGLVGRYLHHGGAVREIEGVAADGDVSIASAFAGLRQHDLVGFAADATGVQLTWLDDAEDQAENGIVTELRRVTDPGGDSWLQNSLFAEAAGSSLPAGWETVGAAGIRALSGAGVRFGEKGVNVFGVVGDGIRSTWTAYHDAVWISAAMWIYIQRLDAGAAVRIEIEDSNGNVWIDPESKQALIAGEGLGAVTQVRRWVRVVTNTVGDLAASARYRVRILLEGTEGATGSFDLDAVTLGPGEALTTPVQGLLGNRLWAHAKRRIARLRDPDTQTHRLITMTIIDRERLEGRAGIVLGQDALVSSPAADLKNQRGRVTTLTRDLVDRGRTELTVAG